MHNFLLISHALDVLPLLVALSNQPRLWDQDRLRTGFPGSVHSAVSDVLLHFQRPDYDASTGDVDHECFPREAWWALPDARPLIFGLMARVQATRLGRVMITRLPPGELIPCHTDSPLQTAYWRRHHITLCSPPECQFLIEGEMLSLAPGSCWWVDNSKVHSVSNHEGTTERISLIVDVHVPGMEQRYEHNRSPQPQRPTRKR